MSIASTSEECYGVTWPTNPNLALNGIPQPIPESEWVCDSTRLLALSASRKKEESERYKGDLNPSLKAVRLGVAL